MSKQPIVKETEYLDKNGKIFASHPGEGNISDSLRSSITKRSKWSDGIIVDKVFEGKATTGRAERKDKECIAGFYQDE